MQLIEELRDEHARIDRALGALRGFVAARAAGEAVPRDGARFVRFFRVYADRFHHAREERVLFPALAEHLEIAVDRGPIHALMRDHMELRATLSAIAQRIDADLDADGRAQLSALATAYSRALWLHIDAENSVLFPESEARLQRAGVRELPTFLPSAEEEGALADVQELIARWPSVVDAAIVRGEGCAICPSFGVRCDGIEREWWSEEEWDEFPHRVG